MAQKLPASYTRSLMWQMTIIEINTHLFSEKVEHLFIRQPIQKPRNRSPLRWLYTQTYVS